MSTEPSLPRGFAEHLEGVAAEEAIRPDVDKAIRQYQRGLLTGAELAEAVLLAYPANICQHCGHPLDQCEADLLRDV